MIVARDMLHLARYRDSEGSINAYPLLAGSRATVSVIPPGLDQIDALLRAEQRNFSWKDRAASDDRGDRCQA